MHLHPCTCVRSRKPAASGERNCYAFPKQAQRRPDTCCSCLGFFGTHLLFQILVFVWVLVIMEFVCFSVHTVSVVVHASGTVREVGGRVMGTPSSGRRSRASATRSAAAPAGAATARRRAATGRPRTSGRGWRGGHRGPDAADGLFFGSQRDPRWGSQPS